MSERKDLDVIADLVPAGSRVLDLGCGSGELLSHLVKHKGCSGYGVEIDDANLRAAMARGIDVLQLNLEEGLAMFGDASFDVVLRWRTEQERDLLFGGMETPTIKRFIDHYERITRWMLEAEPADLVIDLGPDREPSLRA